MWLATEKQLLSHTGLFCTHIKKLLFMLYFISFVILLKLIEPLIISSFSIQFNFFSK